MRPTISALAHPVVRRCCGGVFMLMASAVAIPLAFVDGTHLSRGALPYFLGALIASAVILALSSAASRHEARAQSDLHPPTSQMVEVADSPQTLAEELDSASRDLERMLAQRWAGAPGKPPDSGGERSYFGQASYETETVGIYTANHRARIAELLVRAHALGYLPEGWGGLAANIKNVDQVWLLRYRVATLVNRLCAQQKAPSTLNERVADLLRVGDDIRSELRSNADSSFEERVGTTPFQAFDAWRYDVRWLLRHSAPDVWQWFRNKAVLGRESSLDELASFIDAGLSALREVDVES